MDTRKLWNEERLPDGTIRLIPPDSVTGRIGRGAQVLLGGLAVATVGYLLFQGSRLLGSPLRGAWLFPPILAILLGLRLALTLTSLKRYTQGRRIGGEQLRLRANYLEHRVIVGRWRRVTRITDAWVYLECDQTASGEPTFRVRVRGRGGELTLGETTPYHSMYDESLCVPDEVQALAETIARATEWPLDVPTLLRRRAGYVPG